MLYVCIVYGLKTGLSTRFNKILLLNVTLEGRAAVENSFLNRTKKLCNLHNYKIRATNLVYLIENE